MNGRDAVRFDVLATCGHARRGRLTTPHGLVDTPAFMPVGTAATVKSLTPAQIAETGSQIVLANTYHLLLRPGAAAVAQLGGLHRFMAWPGSILTDSGGYQVFSLADLRRIDDDGVEFRSHIDGALVHLTPETSITLQNQFGADIIMAFDECPSLASDDSPAVSRAVERTIHWARRSKAAHRREDQALYGIVQGGLDLASRTRCLEAIVEIGFAGYAIGGLSVGEPPPQTWAFLREFTPLMPAGRPRYVMGVGTPRDLVEAVAAGADQFDCVLPTRNGRKGYAFTSAGVVRLRNAVHRVSSEPLDPACPCYTCRNFSRGYLRHLFMAGETLGGALVSLHNVTFYQGLMRQMRGAIEAGRFDAWRAEFLAGPLAVAGGAAGSAEMARSDGQAAMEQPESSDPSEANE